MIADATADTQRESDALEERFFSTPPASDDPEPEIEGWSPAPMSASNRLAMKATIAMLSTCALATLAFAAFSEHLFVFPAPLTAAHAQLPIPSAQPSADTAPQPPALAPPQPAPSAAPPPSTTAALAPAPAAPAPTLAPAPAPAPAPALALASAPASARAPAPARASALARASAPAPARRSRATATAPRSSSPSASLVARAHTELARGRAREAQQLARQAIDADRTHARAYIVLGAALDALGDSAGKRAAFRACVQHAQGPLLSTCRTLAR